MFLVLACLAVAVVALSWSGYLARQARTVGAGLESPRCRRQLRRRRALTRRQRARGRAHRRMTRRLRRRRQVQACIRAMSGRAVSGAPEGSAAIEIDLTDTAEGPANEIDLTDTAVGAAIEIDLTDSVVCESEITLESGDTVETGVVGPRPER